jgi:hypothetical protein
MTFELGEGPDDEVRELMSLAIMRPKQFCKALRCLADAAKGLESAGATERALGRWAAKQKTAKAIHVKIEICLACALFNSET